MKYQKQFILSIIAALVIAVLSPTIKVGAEEVTPDEDYISDEYVPEDYGIDLSQVDTSDYDPVEFAQEFELLIEDDVFTDLEDILSRPQVETVYEKNPITGKLEAKQQVLPAIAAAALRQLLTKVGRPAATKAWNIARPHVQKALKAPSKYYLDSPKGGRIIQVRLKSNKQPIFRLDFHYIDGKGPYLHYHVAPNMKKHHML
jgi:hypothetical protein